MNTYNENVLSIDDLDTPIYRIFSMKWFERLVTSNENGLVRPSAWDDPYENFFLKCNAKTQAGELVSLESLSKSWYGQCWTLNKDSDAMWRIYSPKSDGVRVETTPRKLIESLWDDSDPQSSLKHFIGKVKYQSKDVIEQFLKTTSFSDLSFGGHPGNFAQTLFTKRLEFKHEAEIRVLYHEIDNDSDYEVKKHHFDSDQILSEIALDPRLIKTDYIKNRESLISLGVKPEKIVQSDLYKIDVQTIRL